MTNRTVAVELIAKIQGYKAGLASARASTVEFGSDLERMRKHSNAQFDQLALGVGAVGAAMVGLVAYAVKLGMQFDKTMSDVGAISNASGADMGRLRQAALDAGQATVFSATQAAQAEAELAKAGLSTADILGGALKGSLSLAAAGSLDLAEAAEVAAKTMGQFQLSGRDVGHIADLLAGAANASATDVHGLGEALKMGGGIAHAAGMSLEDTTTVLTAFAKQALVGSDAGTSLKTMLMMLQAPTDKAKGAMAEYGLSVYDANGNMIDAYGLADQLQRSFGTLTGEQRNAAFATIFGADATRAANALYAQGAAGLRNLNKEMLAQADAARVAGQKTDNLAGDLERLKGSIESAMISAQSGSTGPLRILAQTLDSLVGTFSEMPGWVQQSVLVLAGLTGAGLLAAVAFIKVRGTVRDVMEAMREAGPGAARFADGLSRTATFAGKAGLALTALAIAGTVAQQFDDWSVDVNGMADALERLGKTGKAGGELTRQFGSDMAGLKDAFNAPDNPFTTQLKAAEALIPGLRELNREWLAGSPTDYAEQIKTVDTELASMVRGGNIEAARGAVFQMMQVTGQSYDQILAKLPQFKNANAEAQVSSAEQGAQAQRTAIQNHTLGGAFGDAATAADGLINKFKELNGGALNLREAQRNAEQAVDDLSAALLASGGSMDITTEEGRAAAAAADHLAESAAAVAQKTYEQTHSVTAAKAAYDQYIENLRQTMVNAGVAAPAIANLISQIANMPTTIPVTIDVYANLHMDDVREALRVNRRWGGITHAADGLLSSAAMFDGKRTLYGFNEPETGGEAFIPKNGEYGRSMEILSGAAKWYNASVVPNGMAMGGTSGGGGPGHVTVIIDGQVLEPRMVQIIDDRDRQTKRRVGARG